jgi:methionyl-tRNA synthetase
MAKDPSKEEALHKLLYQLADSLRIVAILISPILPRSADQIFDQLNWKMESTGKEARFKLEETNWGGLPCGHKVGKPIPLFESWGRTAERLVLARVQSELQGDLIYPVQPADRGIDAIVHTPERSYLIQVKAFSDPDPYRVSQAYLQFEKATQARTSKARDRAIFAATFLADIETKSPIERAIGKARAAKRALADYRVYHISEL